MNPIFLTGEEVMAIHAHSLAKYGGQDGVRDQGLLRSALAQPEASFGGQWLHEDLFSMAAAYAFHVAQNHPFLDGNKRTAIVCALHFLHLNGQTVAADQTAFGDIVFAVAEGRASKDDLATFLRAHGRPWKTPA
jgi:death-on-curing protein